MEGFREAALTASILGKDLQDVSREEPMASVTVRAKKRQGEEAAAKRKGASIAAKLKKVQLENQQLLTEVQTCSAVTAALQDKASTGGPQLAVQALMRSRRQAEGAQLVHARRERERTVQRQLDGLMRREKECAGLHLSLLHVHAQLTVAEAQLEVRRKRAVQRELAQKATSHALKGHLEALLDEVTVTEEERMAARQAAASRLKSSDKSIERRGTHALTEPGGRVESGSGAGTAAETEVGAGRRARVDERAASELSRRLQALPRSAVDSLVAAAGLGVTVDELLHQLKEESIDFVN